MCFWAFLFVCFLFLFSCSTKHLCRCSFGTILLWMGSTASSWLQNLWSGQVTMFSSMAPWNVFNCVSFHVFHKKQYQGICLCTNFSTFPPTLSSSDCYFSLHCPSHAGCANWWSFSPAVRNSIFSVSWWTTVAIMCTLCSLTYCPWCSEDSAKGLSSSLTPSRLIQR